MADIFGKTLLLSPRQELLEDVQALLDKNAQYSPMLHFTLVDSTARTFRAVRAAVTSIRNTHQCPAEE